MASTRLEARRQRERDIVDATRALFDERGMQDAPIEEIAAAVGINKALIYRHFASKEELFVLTITRYLEELDGRLRKIPEDLAPIEQFRAAGEAYIDFMLRYPAFLDCALMLMRRPLSALVGEVSEGILLRLGQAMAACLSRISRILKLGAEQGVFRIEDPDYTANHLYAQALGAMHLARVRTGVRELNGTSGIPEPFPIDPERVGGVVMAVAFATVMAPEAAEAAAKNGGSNGGASNGGASAAAPRPNGRS
jgi:AcrR family transcriptional regulator